MDRRDRRSLELRRPVRRTQHPEICGRFHLHRLSHWRRLPDRLGWYIRLAVAGLLDNACFLLETCQSVASLELAHLLAGVFRQEFFEAVLLAAGDFDLELASSFVEADEDASSPEHVDTLADA